MKLTVKQYASEFKISPQAVYQKIKRGTLNCIEEEGVKYIVVKKPKVKHIEQAPFNEVENKSVKSPSKVKHIEQGIVKDLLKQLKRKDKEFKEILATKDKEIKRLSKKLEKSSAEKEKVYLSYIQELKQLQITHAPSEVIDIEDDAPKKKKKKKSKK